MTELLVPRPVEAVNVTPAYRFRKVGDEGGAPTILYDEIDTVFGPKAKDNEEIRGLLNAGHRRGAVAGRCVVKGKRVETTAEEMRRREIRAQVVALPEARGLTPAELEAAVDEAIRLSDRIAGWRRFGLGEREIMQRYADEHGITVEALEAEYRAIRAEG